MKTNKKAIITAAISGILLAASYGIPANSAERTGAVGECHGVNGCKGKGDCGGVNANGQKHSCAGQNDCKGRGWIGLTKEACDMKGGKFNPKA